MLVTLIFWLLGLVIAITVHEAAHAYMAFRLGDTTAKLEGRLSLNPIVHYDPIGTTMLLVTILLNFVGNAGFMVFGWAKPVPIDPYNLKNQRRDSALISLAGPLSNILIASLFSILLRWAGFISPTYYGLFYLLTVPVISVNISLAVFNLIPIHPLDGGKILTGILPDYEATKVDNFLSKYGTILLLLIIFPIFGNQSLVASFITPIYHLFSSILIP